MNKHILTGGAVLMLAGGTVFGQTNYNQSLAYDQNNPNGADRHWYEDDHSDLFRANEVSVDLFGTEAVDKHTIDHPSGRRVRHDSRWGAGLGVNYFFLRYLGVGAEAYSEDTQHNFVDNVSGSLIARLPIGSTGLAPYVFGGGGHQFDPVIATFGHAGAGLEFRITHHVGIFTDARWVWTDHDKDYGLGRAGVRIAF